MLRIRRSFVARSLGVRIDSHLAMSSWHRVVAVRVDGDVVHDPSLLPAEPHPDRTYVYVVLRGALHLTTSRRVIGPGMFVLASSRAALLVDERARYVGPHRALAMQVERDALPFRRERVGALGGRARRAATELHAALSRGAGPDRFRAAHDALVRELRASGIPIRPRALDGGAPLDPRANDLARALSHALSLTDTRPGLVDLAWPERSARRAFVDVARRYGFVYPGWQSLRRAWTASIASLLLTSPRATPASVAELVGLSSTASLCHALRRAGLPSPRRIQAAARDVRAALRS